MPTDLGMLGDKLSRYRDQLKLTFEDVSKGTGISQDRLVGIESGAVEPNGDELLILSDYYKCDYRFFVSNDKLAPFEQTEILYRKHGDSFSKNDRWAIQEFLYLAECEHFLMTEMATLHATEFKFFKTNKIHKQNGIDAAKQLRKLLGYPSDRIARNVYDDFRQIGLHVFRRSLESSDISGLFIKHPIAGKCILVNYSEDIFRQRFTAAHETAHSILDDDEPVVVSFKKSQQMDYREVGANYFASNYLMPAEFLAKIPDPKNWNRSKVSEWALKLKVSTEALVYALKNNGHITEAEITDLKQSPVPKESKIDPELGADLSALSRQRKLEMLKRGLSDHYVHLCLEAYRKQVVSYGRLAELLLLDEAELTSVMDLFRERPNYAF
jgi:Zn-dependent peptidase ImmA (M78 family)/transcriptional regulator with XRE-family HTH domain